MLTVQLSVQTKIAFLILAIFVIVSPAAFAIEPPVKVVDAPPARSVMVYAGKTAFAGTVADYGSGIKEYTFAGVATQKAELKKAVETLSPGCDSYVEGQKKADEMKVVVYCKK